MVNSLSVLRILTGFTFLAAAAGAQQTPAGPYFTPTHLFAGGAATQLTVYRQDLAPDLIVLWNGAARPTAPGTIQGQLVVSLTADDLAVPGLAVVRIIDPQTGGVKASGNLPVLWNVQPAGAVFDAKRIRFYFATLDKPGDSRFAANSIVAFDPNTGMIGPSVQAGSGLGALALADDASRVYVVSSVDGVVRGFDAATLVKVAEYSILPKVFQGGVAVMPGHPETIAAYYRPDAFHAPHLAIFDAGVMRPAEQTYNPEAGAKTGLLFSSDGQFLFSGSFATEYGGSTLTRFAVGGTGLPDLSPVTAVGGGPIAISGGILYTSLGTLIDPQSMQEIAWLGTSGPIAIDSANNRILEILGTTGFSASTTPLTLQAFDLPGQQPLGSQTIGGVSGYDTGTDIFGQLLRFGRDGLVWAGPYGVLVFHTPLAGPAPSTDAGRVVNAASLQSGPIAPGEVLTIRGTDLGPARAQAAEADALGVFPTEFNDVQVWFGSSAGTVLMTSANQLNVIAPFGLKPGTSTDLQVWHYGLPSAKARLPVMAAEPGLFTRDASGAGAVLATDSNGYSVGGARADGRITLFGTGGGSVSSGSAGTIARSFVPLAAQPQVTLGGQAATVVSAGTMPGLPNGVFQIVVQIPPGLASGSQPVSVNVNGQISPKGATLAIH